MRHLLIILLLALSASWCVNAKAPVWEEVDTTVPAVEQLLEMDQQTEVAVVDGSVYIWTSRPVTVKLFSILGQLITQKEVGAGLHRLTLSSKGIYILRAGSLTKRITL